MYIHISWHSYATMHMLKADVLKHVNLPQDSKLDPVTKSVEKVIPTFPPSTTNMERTEFQKP